MGRVLLVCVLTLGGSAGAWSQEGSATKALVRHYREGEKLAYRMTGHNEGWEYEIRADGIVKQDASGAYFEEYGWSNLVSNKEKVNLPAGSLEFRQQVTLDPNHNPAVPDLSKIDTRLIGPVTDWLTFYVDVWLAAKVGQLSHAGGHFRFPRSAPNSWADGAYVLLGEDAIDFDLTLKDVNPSTQTATLVVLHVPPAKPEIKLPSDWMHKNVGDSPNNWVEVKKVGGKYLAAVGVETFDVEVKLSLSDGKILSATLDNPVRSIERECSDLALTQCGDPKPHDIRRRVEIALLQ